MAKSNFPIIQVLNALTDNAGNEDAALVELQKSQLKPVLMRIRGPRIRVENEEAASRIGKLIFILNHYSMKSLAEKSTRYYAETTLELSTKYSQKLCPITPNYD